MSTAADTNVGRHGDWQGGTRSSSNNNNNNNNSSSNNNQNSATGTGLNDANTFFPTEQCEVTANKIALLILIEMYCECDSAPTAEVVAFRQELGFLIMDQIQCASRHVETNLRDLCVKIEGFTGKGKETVALLKSKLAEFDSPHSLDDFFQNAKQFLSDQMVLQIAPIMERSGSANGGKIYNNSFLAMFVKTMILNYESMPFCQSMELFSLLCAYRDFDDDTCATIHALSEGEAEQSLNRQIVELETASCENVKTAATAVSAKKGKRASNECSIQTPAALQANIDTMARLAPNVSKTHFVSYMNALRVGCVCEAAENLRRYFDLNKTLLFENEFAIDEGKDGQKVNERRALFQYVSLSLAVLNIHFGFLSEAKRSLYDCIRTAQALNDEKCLASAIGWLYSLLNMELNISYSMKTNKYFALLEKFVERAEALDLKGLIVHGNSLLIRNYLSYGKDPKVVLKTLLDATIDSIKTPDLAAKSAKYLLQSTAWQTYGNQHLSCLYTQLHLSFFGSASNVDTLCDSYCHMARHLYCKGLIDEAFVILENMKKRFPLSSFVEHQHLYWYYSLKFQKSLHAGRIDQSKNYLIRQLSTCNSLRMCGRLEACLPSVAVLYGAMGEYRFGADFISGLRTVSRQGLPPFDRTEYLSHWRFLDVYCCLLLSYLNVKGSDLEEALYWGLKTVSLSDCFNFHGLKWHAEVILAEIFLKIGLPGKALRLIESTLPFLQTGNSLYILGQAFYVHGMCVLEVKAQDSVTQIDLRKALVSFMSANTHFSQSMCYAEALMTLKPMILIHTKLGQLSERNALCRQYRKLVSEHQCDSRSAFHSNSGGSNFSSPLKGGSNSKSNFKYMHSSSSMSSSLPARLL
eukprot:Nk52_evm101s352 gene=Nk52_evmTU101s352